MYIETEDYTEEGVPESAFKQITKEMWPDNNQQTTTALQPLQQDETICYEDEFRPISGMCPPDVDAYVIRVEAKQSGIKEFTVTEATKFECVVGNALVISNGTSNVRMLNVYDLNTGKELLQVTDNFMGNIVPDKNRKGFTFYKYSEDMPSVHWDAKRGEWLADNDVPSSLYNQEFHNTIAKLGDQLYDGMRLVALQRSHINIETKDITYQKQYKWSDI